MTRPASPSKPEFSELVDRFGRELYVFVWRMLSDKQDAEDCLQEALLRAYRAYPRLQGEVNYRAWLYRIAGNSARTQWRRRQRREAEFGQQAHEQVRVWGNPAEEALESKQQLAALRRAVRALPFKQQQALLLRRFQGLSYAEVGAVLACSPEAARANAYQALKRLRKTFAAEGQGGA